MALSSVLAFPLAVAFVQSDKSRRACTMGRRGLGGRVVWGAGLSSCDLQVAGSIPIAARGHATFPTTGASVNAWYNLYEAVTGRWIEIYGAWSEIGNIADSTENANNY